MKLRAFRKSDRKLISEYCGRGILQVYNMIINDFLDDGETPPAPIPAGTAIDPKAAAAAKGAKKDDKGKGKGGGAAVGNSWFRQ